MRKLKKRLASFGVGLTMLVASVMPPSASAVSTIPWPGAFTPQNGSFFATSTVVSVRDLRWSLSQVLTFNPPLNPTQEINGLEFEFRPQPDKIARPNGTHDIWARATDQVSNLPVFYCEFQPDDYDDVAVCCGDLRVLSSSTTYYGHMFMEKKPSFTIAHLPYTFESEYGTWVGIPSIIEQDYLPVLCATYLNGEYNVTFGGVYSW